MSDKQIHNTDDVKSTHEDFYWCSGCRSTWELCSRTCPACPHYDRNARADDVDVEVEQETNNAIR